MMDTFSSLHQAMLIMVFCVMLLASKNAYATTCPKPDENTNTVKYNDVNAEFPKSTLEQTEDYEGSLQGFFNLANSFLNTVQPESPVTAFDLTLEKLDSLGNLQDDIIKYEMPIMIAAGFGVLFLLLFPIVGLCFCCCRCCGNCGGKMEQSERASQKHCCCFFEALFMLLITILILCGVLFMFFTNDATYKGAKQSSEFATKTITGVTSIAKGVVDGAKDITSNLVPCAGEYAVNDLSDDSIKKGIGKKVMDAVRGSVSGLLVKVEGKVADKENLTKHIADIGTTLSDCDAPLKGVQDSVDKAKGDLNQLVKDCRAKEAGQPSIKTLCDEMENREDDIKAVSVPSLPNVDLDSINSDLKKINLTQVVMDANKMIDDIPETASNKSENARRDVSKAINDAVEEVKKTVNKIVGDVDKMIEDTKVEVNAIKDDYLDANSEYMKYLDYFYYAYIGLSAVVALIVVLLFCGLVFGSCGYRKDAYPEERSGTATCGGNFLMAATGFMFIFSWILMLFCVVWFALGIHLHIVCRETKGDKLSASVDYFLAGKLKIDGHEIKLSEIMARCEKNEPLYTAIGGENIYNVSAAINISQYTSGFDVAGIAKKIDLTDQKVLSDDINKTLDDIDISQATKSYEPEIKQVNDFDITQELQNISSLVTKLNNAGQADLGNKLDAIRIDLQGMVNTNVTTLKTKIGTDLKKELSGVSELATGFKSFAVDVLKDAHKSQSFIEINLQVIIVDEILNLSLRIVGWFTQLITHLTVQLATTMWKCSPLTKLYGGVHAYFCDNLIQNLNGFWMALGWCLLFFVPAIIFAVKLAKYYRKMKNKDEEDGEHYAYNPDYDTAPRGEEIQMKDVQIPYRNPGHPPYNPVPSGPRGSPLFKNSIGPANL